MLQSGGVMSFLRKFSEIPQTFHTSATPALGTAVRSITSKALMQLQPLCGNDNPTIPRQPKSRHLERGERLQLMLQDALDRVRSVS